MYLGKIESWLWKFSFFQNRIMVSYLSIITYFFFSHTYFLLIDAHHHNHEQKHTLDNNTQVWGRKQLFPYFYSLLSLVLASIHAPSFSVWQTAEPVLYLFFQPNEVSILLSKHQTVLCLFIQEIISRVKRINFRFTG